MKKLLACAVLISFVFAAACKKAEEKKADSGSTSTQQKKQGDQFKPQAPKKKQPRQAASLKIFNEQTLVSDIPQAQYATLTTSKVKIGNKQVQAVLLKDLLGKYNIKGKNVVLAGQTVSTPLTWEQATGSDVYVYMTPKKFMKVHTTSKNLSSMKFPKRLEKITVTESSAKPTT
ncbi:MAG TPA: hypothetical protein VLH08_09030 [Acidobacteriota bacterium]|jgi:hypothetical protein|nr:hypothetical protein [Acidobacteriota bacterium]